MQIRIRIELTRIWNTRYCFPGSQLCFLPTTYTPTVPHLGVILKCDPWLEGGMPSISSLAQLSQVGDASFF